jgi:hypothetical protein
LSQLKDLDPEILSLEDDNGWLLFEGLLVGQPAIMKYMILPKYSKNRTGGHHSTVFIDFSNPKSMKWLHQRNQEAAIAREI